MLGVEGEGSMGIGVPQTGRVTKRKEEEEKDEGRSEENMPDLIPFIKLACCRT